MATKAIDVQKEAVQRQQDTETNIRIALTSTNVTNLERTTRELLKTANDNDVKVKGPVRLPVKRLRITTRKSPNGQGTNTWDKFEMRIHKRIVDLVNTKPSSVKDLTRFFIDAGVDIDVFIPKRHEA
ncbi:MAG: hypothetical protein KVP17_002075 [Porospora cf. gigantea B]|nr:MAG: hypothetical protein KVP17_002075 [Porospora cf. gigantea B]KAH0487554.1 MAG: hypothetical protein KVP18_000466 [Porospora cf. gigantea A]